MLDVGHILDRKYEVIKFLGEGGMGTVYLCKNTRLGNLWAVKEFKSDWKDKADFLAEPNILKNLNHIGIPRIIDIFYENENLYMVEDYIEGITLKDFVERKGNLTAKLIIDISLQLCDILEYLHSFNPPIIYRDLKPSNIMIQPNNKIYLIDFGIARIYKEGQTGDTMVLGSKGYIAPEQLMNIQSNIQTDIYSLGATMYFMYTGEAPGPINEAFIQSTSFSVSNNSLLKIIHKALLTDTSDRYSIVNELKRDLQASANVADYDKTKLAQTPQNDATIARTVMMSSKKTKKKLPYIIVGILLFLVLLIIMATLWLNKENKKNLSPSNTSSTQDTELKKDTPEPPKETIEKDILVRGVLFKDKPQVLSGNITTSKGKGKDKKKEENTPLHLLFDLNPNASISNSKFKISADKLEITEDYVIISLFVDNETNSTINLDLSKTYLVNGENSSFKCYNNSSGNQVSIAQNTSNQEIKLYFAGFDFKGAAYIIKTSLNSSINRDINLFIDIK